MAREKGWTLRQVALWHTRTKRTFVGTPEQVADEIQRWFEQGGADGFNFFEALPNTSLKDFVALVVPVLQARGIYRTEYDHDTFRGNLGLPIPENRYTAQRREAAAALEEEAVAA